MRELAILLLLGAPAAAQERCWLLCSETYDLVGTEAAARLEGWLGRSLPPGTTVERLHEEGFQDAFVRARLDADAKGLATVLAAMALGPDALGPIETEADGTEASAPDWWDWTRRSGVRRAEGALPALPHVTILVAPSVAAPGRWTIYLSGFQT